MTRSAALGLACALAALAACAVPERDPPPPSAASVNRDAQAELDRLDQRAPLPLLPMMANHQKENMRDHLAAVQEIVVGLAANDFAKIEAASERIGFSEQMGGMCKHMGAGAPGFTEQALAFHHTADRIGDAARARDQAGVVSALGQTLAACTGCHASYKQVVTSDLP